MRIDLLGTSFTIQSDEDPAYLRNLVGYYRDKLAEVRESVNTSDDLKVAILGALTVVDELFRERHRLEAQSVDAEEGDTSDYRDSFSESQESDDRTDEMEEIANRLIERIDSALELDS